MRKNTDARAGENPLTRRSYVEIQVALIEDNR